MRHHTEGKLLITKYPELKGVIISNLSVSHQFRALCADYNICADAVKYWSNVPSTISQERRKEFAMLLGDLEKEILVFLEDVTKHQRSKRNTRGQQ